MAESPTEVGSYQESCVHLNVSHYFLTIGQHFRLLAFFGSSYAAGRSASWKRASYSKCVLTFLFPFAALAMNATAQHSDAASAARQKLECVNLAESIWFLPFCSRLWFKQYCGMHWFGRVLNAFVRSRAHACTRLTLFKWASQRKHPLTPRLFRKQWSRID